jgi:hypothetical protein
MTAFWIAVVVGAFVAVAYITLAVQAFARVRRDVLRAAASGEPDDESGLGDDGVFTWKALGAVVGSTLVIALLGVRGVFWYLPPILAIGSSVAVIAAFLIDRRRTT